jgi:probable rRNA maturation factor
MIKPNSAVQFHFPAVCSLTQRQALKSFIRFIFRRENRPLESIAIVFCDDPFLLTLNREFLHHDYYTDILSFPLSPRGKPLIAEIYISCDRVRDNAKNLDTSFREELHRVIFHGVLHFCGYGDKSQAEIRQMRGLEDKYLALYFRRKKSQG